jgi:tetratricopeptide (TPR) repeat protein
MFRQSGLGVLMLLYRARIAALALPMLMTGTGIAQNAQAQTTASLAAQAQKLTAQHQLDKAEQAYRRMFELDIASGAPALARFLQLTGRTSDSVALIDSPQLKSAGPLVQARTAVAAQRPQHAVDILKQSTAPAELYPRTVLLLNQLQALGHKAEAASAVADALVQLDLLPMERLDLLRQLGTLADCDSIQRALLPATQALVTSSTIEYQRLRQAVWEVVLNFSACPAFSAMHEKALADPAATPSARWLAALCQIRRGNAEAAYKVLAAIDTDSLTAREKEIVLQELAMLQSNDLPRALALREELAKSAGVDHDRLNLEAAQLAFRIGSAGKSLSFLQHVHRDKLEPELQLVFDSLSVGISSSTRGVSETLALFVERAKNLKYEDLRQLAEAPFSGSPDEALPLRYRDAILGALNQPAPSPDLYILLLSAEHRLNSDEGMMAALSGYVRANPKSVQAEQELAAVSANVASRLATSSSTAATSDVNSIADLAAESLWNVVRTRPYEPESYGKLMELYKMFGQPEKAQRVPLYLCSSTTAPAEAVALAAYIYATNGMADQALPLYERALKLEPKNSKFRLNYAGALSRVGRFDEAESIFHDLIRNGADKHQYHTHELYAGAYELASQRGAVPQFVQFLQQLVNQPAVPQRDVFLIEAGKLLRSRGHAQESVQFFEQAQREFPDRAEDAQEELVDTYVGLKDFDKAEQQVKAMQSSRGDAATALRVQYNLGIIKAARGDIDGAITMWTKLAEQNPKSKQAARSVLAAAQTLRQANRPADARAVLQKFLAGGTADVESEAAARQILEAMQADQAATPDGAQPPAGK